MQTHIHTLAHMSGWEISCNKDYAKSCLVDQNAFMPDFRKFIVISRHKVLLYLIKFLLKCKTTTKVNSKK